MQKNKNILDEEDDIEIKINSFDFYYYKEYIVDFSHKSYPHFGGKTVDVEPKNIQQSPGQNLKDFINKLKVDDKVIQIDLEHFNNLNKYNLGDNLSLKDNDCHLNSYLETRVRDELSFANLSEQGKRSLQITPIRIIYKDINSIEVEYEFKFKKSGVTSVINKNVTFEKQ